MTRWLVARLGLLALHAGYVLVQLEGAPRAAAVVIVVALAALAATLVAPADAARARASLAAAGLVLAALHARLVPADAPWLPLQLALAAALAASTSASLLAERALRAGLGAGAIVVTVGCVAAGLVLAPVIARHGLELAGPALGLVALALVRPLGALGAALAAAGWNDGARDPLLWWRPEVAPAAQEIGR